jgi:drug/metabolite transporter (DMT)-like permease
MYWVGAVLGFCGFFLTLGFYPNGFMDWAWKWMAGAAAIVVVVFKIQTRFSSRFRTSQRRQPLFFGLLVGYCVGCFAIYAIAALLSFLLHSL